MQKSIYTEHYALLLSTLREGRKAAGLSQVELARRLDLTQSFVGKCERGERRLDAIELRNWSQALGLTLDKVVSDLEAAILNFEAVKSNAGKTARKTARKTTPKPARKTLRKNGGRTV
ncbi:helix-turn-helix domain-containing protein [Caballeronia sp. SBC1]|uniref:helix-turn-helix domain-containing protein n=1 Tax=Caballeronia sp. SBC1 TaxID=2705548 RepID=UPI00140741F6|nr:helix-turn-helix transcriptional regulator [Caballeronia sp. SBC1]